MFKSVGVVILLTFATGAAQGQGVSACSGTDFFTQETTQTDCSVVNPGGQTVITTTDLLAPTVVTTFSTHMVDTYASTLTATLNGSIVFQASFAAPLSDPSGAAAVAQADAVLSADGVIAPSPFLTMSSTTPESSTIAYVPTSPTLTLADLATCSISVIASTPGTCAGVNYLNAVSSVNTFGPATVNIGLGATDSFTVLAGQLDINLLNYLNYTVTQEAVTTNTDLITQQYEITATTATAQAPEIDMGSSASALTLLFGSLAVLMGRRRASALILQNRFARESYGHGQD